MQKNALTRSSLEKMPTEKFLRVGGGARGRGVTGHAQVGGEEGGRVSGSKF